MSMVLTHLTQVVSSRREPELKMAEMRVGSQDMDGNFGDRCSFFFSLGTLVFSFWGDFLLMFIYFNSFS